jgi:hypothetical protein
MEMDFQGSDVKEMKLLNAWDNICRQGGCSAEQLRELHWLRPNEKFDATFFQELSPTQELELEDVAMWLGQAPSRPLN